MNLTKRTAFVVVPVILLAYCFAAWQVYRVHQHSLIQLEKSYVSAAVDSLQASFRDYHGFLNGLLFNIRDGERLAIFLNEEDRRYRDASLGFGLGEIVDAYQRDSMDSLSFGIVSSDGGVEYYFENSGDPFAVIRPDLMKVVNGVFVSGNHPHWEHMEVAGKNCLVMVQLIDARTLAKPFKGDLSNALALAVSADLTAFDEKLDNFRSTYPANVTWTTKPQSIDTMLGASVEMLPGYFMNISVDDVHVVALMENVRRVLALMVIFLTLMTAILIIVLVRRYITGPVAELDAQLERVIDGSRSNIDIRKGDDEISHLAQKIHLLYGQLSELLARTTDQSLSDVLTSVPNRRAFDVFASERLKEVSEAGETLSVIYVDLDNFKFVNDRHGHHVGDQLLKDFSNRLAKLAEDQAEEHRAFVARLSGDEFVMTVSNMADNQLHDFADNILQVFEKGFAVDRGSLPVTVSVGVATSPKDGNTLSKLVSNADVALYSAKHSGRNQYAFYSEDMAVKARRRGQILEQLKSINFDDEFHLVFMPIVDTSGSAVGAEALLRWESESLGFVGPDEFIPIAENSGLHEKIDFWVIDRALENFADLQNIFGEKFRISINISSAHFGADALSNYLMDKIEEYGVSPLRVALEITETFQSAHGERMLRILRRLRAHGFNIEIDDFGAGFTSLEQLISYPADGIKLDRLFLANAFEADRVEFIAAIIKLCRQKDVTITAEGVETREQMETLIAAGCTYLQGYFFSKPLRLESLDKYRRTADDNGVVGGPPASKGKNGLRAIK